MDKQPEKNHGQNIGNIVRSTLQSGDLSRLKDLGPAIEEAVKDIPGVSMETRSSAPPAVRTPTQPQPAERPKPWPQHHRQQAQQPWKGSGQRKNEVSMPKGVVRIVFGVMGLVAFGLAALVFLGLSLATSMSLLPLAVGFGVVAGLSGLLLGSGVQMNKNANLAKQYYAQLNKKPVAQVVEIAAATGKTPKQVRKDVKKLHKAGLLSDVRFDDDKSCLIRGMDAWQHYLDSQKTMAQRAEEEAERKRRLADPATAGIEAFKAEGVETIRKIQAANAAIPGEEISLKLSRLESTCTRIFGYVEQYPEKLPETRKFMNYYLPTTLKLVDKYRQFEEMDYQPENVKLAKSEIERSLDTIDVAFNNMLESLYQHETLDVSTDIEVLEQMLEQEGLTGKKFEVSATAAAPAEPADQTTPELKL